MKKTNIESHFDKISTKYDRYKKRNRFYYTNLKTLLASIIPRNQKVLEVGCGTGDILSSLKPSLGYGMDISSEMIKLATLKHKNLKFSTKYPSDKYDYIFMSDVIEHLETPETVFKQISKLLTENGAFINTMANPIWEPLLMVWEKLGLKMPEGPHVRIKYEAICSMLEKSNLKIIKHDYKLLIPINIPLITPFVNRYLEKYFKKYAFIEYFVATKI